MIHFSEKIWWTHFGNLLNFKSTNFAGCYVFIWDKKRIIYIGTSSDIEKRLYNHVDLLEKLLYFWDFEFNEIENSFLVSFNNIF